MCFSFQFLPFGIIRNTRGDSFQYRGKGQYKIMTTNELISPACLSDRINRFAFDDSDAEITRMGIVRPCM